MFVVLGLIYRCQFFLLMGDIYLLVIVVAVFYIEQSWQKIKKRCLQSR